MPTQIAGPHPLAVLLVEDNPDDAMLLERHLRKTGFLPTISRVETAAEMKAALSTEPLPDVILADYNLPSFSGPEALRLLKQTGKDLPFIMMSGAMSEETAVASMRAGAQDFVIKQNLARLTPALERELREAESRRANLQTERALEASEARFHRLVDAMPVGLLLSDATGKITYANGAVEELLGWTGEEMLRGMVGLRQICGSLELPEGESIAAASETLCTRRDGSQVVVLLGRAYLNPESSSTERQIAAFLLDLSQQKKSEEALRRTEKLAVAGRLAASIAHEINNPLAAVTNCLFLAEQTELTDDGRTYLKMAQTELNRVAQITVQTLRFHRQSSRPNPSDVRELVDTVLALFDSRLKRQQITVRSEFRTDRSIYAFEGEIRQVIVNLLGNAIDASSPGSEIVVRTSASTHPSTGVPGLVLTIADHGTGMSAATVQRLFEPFFSTKGITGTGLGLWVSKEIVERHNGFTQVRSRLSGESIPGGTVFRVFLPFSEAPKAAPETATAEPS